MKEYFIYLLCTPVNETILSAEMREKDIDLAFLNALVTVYEISHNGQSSVVDTAWAEVTGVIELTLIQLGNVKLHPATKILCGPYI